MSTKESSEAARVCVRGATEGSSIPRTHCARSETCIAHASAIEIPATFAVRACSARRVPSHSGHVPKVTARSTKALTWGCMASGSLLSIDLVILGTRPS